MSPATRAGAEAALLRSVLALPELSTARVAAAYLSIGTEPRTDDLVMALRSRDVRVILPVLRDDLDLDWADYDLGVQGQKTARGLREPAGPRSGVEAVTSADVVIVPALAVAADGTRLGRGGGSYDRALARVGSDRPVVALLYDGELLPEVPTDPHDRKVTVAVTPSEIRRFAS
jgi:5-formyltetrahydrofolate cyclo-ligase